MKVVDPTFVRVEIDSDKGMTTILPAGKEGAEAKLPDASPPYSPGYREPTMVRRYPNGAIDLVCDNCQPKAKMIVPPNGTIVFAPDFSVASFDWKRSEMRVRIHDERDASFGAWSAYDADIVSPWGNVAEIRRVSTPDRALGAKLVLSSLVCLALGGFALADGVPHHHDVPTTLGIVGLSVGGVLGIGGGWYFFAPSRNEVLYHGEPPGPPPKPKDLERPPD